MNNSKSLTFIDFFAGIGGFRRGMELAGHKCVGFCEFDKYARASYISMHLLTDEQREYLASLPVKKRQKEILDEKYLNGEWGAVDIGDVRGEDIPKADCWCGGFPCFVAGTLVNTTGGLKSIEQVKEGDFVLTHKNRYQKVLQTMSSVKKGICTVKVQGSPHTQCTPNHPFYIKKENISEPYWEVAENLKCGDLVMLPKADADALWVPVRDIVYEHDRTEEVFNLEVETDNSYTANGLAVHNCQDISIAGRQEGLDGKRSGLFYEIIRLLKEQKEEDRPEWILLENVKNLLSIDRGRGMLAVLSELDACGYDVEWDLFNSKEYVPQNRERIYLVGHLRTRGSTKIFPIKGTDGKDNVYRINQVGLDGTSKRKNPNQYRVYDPDGQSPTLNQMGGGGREPHVTVDCRDKIKIDVIGKAYERDNYGDNRNRIIGVGGAVPSMTATQYKEPYRIGLFLSETQTPREEE